MKKCLLKKLTRLFGLLLLSFNVHAQEYVDLGLSVNWATYNVGATSVEEVGMPFVAGTTIIWEKGKNMSRVNAVQHLTDFSGNSLCDAATANWGDGWRTPTIAEWRELFKQCKMRKSKIETSNGLKLIGVTFVGPNGNSIFLPNSPYLPRLYGGYQSSTPNKQKRLWVFMINELTPYDAKQAIVDMGFYVRPVKNK